MNNKTLSLLSIVISACGLLLTISVFGAFWNQSLALTMFLLAFVVNLVGVVIGFIARRAKVNSLNNLGIGIGLLALAAIGLSAIGQIYDAL
ncbi:MAG: hypothetical protein ACRCY3_17050 [Sphingorhabdus sp.]